jgi:hypothetical protein
MPNNSMFECLVLVLKRTVFVLVRVLGFSFTPSIQYQQVAGTCLWDFEMWNDCQ